MRVRDWYKPLNPTARNVRHHTLTGDASRPRKVRRRKISCKNADVKKTARKPQQHPNNDKVQNYTMYTQSDLYTKRDRIYCAANKMVYRKGKDGI